MSDAFIGEIRMFAGNFAPRGWAYCDGQILSISQFTALFSLFGTTYGGDGRSTFALPDMRGRIPVHKGRGLGLTDRRIGSKAGEEDEFISLAQLAQHNHDFLASTDAAGDTNATGNTTAEPTGANIYGTGNPVAMNSAAITSTGGNQSHTNLMPTLCIHFIVSLEGTFPSRS